MKSSLASRKSLFRKGYLPALIAFAVIGVAVLSGNDASANHPVYVEGNCNPFQPFVSPGSCGDFDGDGRVGTAEDADSATDRIFGTINAALGNTALGNAADGSGPIAPSTAAQNGRVLIVSTGRFAETLTITGSSGNVQIEAAPGVEANIDAVVQGDAGNTGRQNAVGVDINSPNTRIMTLRNLTIRNYFAGVRITGNSRVNIDNCNIDNNRNFGILVEVNGRLTANHIRVVGTGFRVNPAVDNTPSPGDGLRVEGSGVAFVSNSTFFHNFRFGISRSATGTVNLTNVVFGDNGTDTVGVVAPVMAGGISASDEQ